MLGIDISNWQEDSSVMDGYEFVFIKASEGKNYKDEMLDKHFGYLAKSESGNPLKNKNYGFYHYARPDLGNTPEVEAESFLGFVGHHAGYCAYALDWENKALAYDTSWALKFLEIVRDKTGANPLIYINSSEENTGKYNNIRDAGFPLWVADWSSMPTVQNWPTYAIWQFRRDPIDEDKTNPSLYWDSLLHYHKEQSLKDEIYKQLEDIKHNVARL